MNKHKNFKEVNTKVDIDLIGLIIIGFLLGTIIGLLIGVFILW